MKRFLVGLLFVAASIIPAPARAQGTSCAFAWDGASFNVYFSSSPTGPEIKVTNIVLPTPFSFTWTDPSTNPGPRFVSLTAVNAAGQEGVHSPRVLCSIGITATLVMTGDPVTGPYALEAQVFPAGAYTVVFVVDGASFHNESMPAYCIFSGDGPCVKKTIKPGTHTVQANVYAKGGTDIITSANITFVEGTTP